MTNTGRFAPSPTGDFHLGNLRTAILAWAWARTTGRHFVLRIEDIDRERAGSAQRQIEDLQAIGIDWDGEPLIQTARAGAHEAALASLAARGLIFECYCTRRDIREAASAPHVPPGHYPGTCLSLSESERDAKRAALAALGRAPALRLAAPSPEWTVFDELHGSYTGPVDHFVVRRADGVPAYNLAAVVDDAYQGVDQVVRGFDLLSQAPAQAQLAHLLGAPEPTYAHVPSRSPFGGAPGQARRRGHSLGFTRPGLVHRGRRGLHGLPWSTRARCASDIADALGIEGCVRVPTEPWGRDAAKRVTRRSSLPHRSWLSPQWSADMKKHSRRSAF